MGLTSTALAAKPLTGTFKGKIIGRDVTYTDNGTQVEQYAGVLRLQLDDGPSVGVFCIEHDVRVQTGDRYRSDGPIQQLRNGCQIRYLLAKYPGSSAKTADEAAARQLAIWVFSDGFDPATLADTKALHDRVVALVNEARGEACPDTRATIPELTLEPPTASAQVGQTITYIVRVAPPGSVQRANVALTGPATLADGTQQGSIALDAQGAGTFGVIGASTGDADITVSVPYQLDSGVVFSHIDDSHKTQRLVMAEQRDFTARATARAAWAAGAPAPTASALPAETPTAPALPAETSTALPAETPTATPKSPPKKERSTPTEQSTPAPQATLAITSTTGVSAEQVATPTTVAAVAQPAGGAPPAQPRQLPRTGAPTDALGPISLVIAALLLAGGLLLRRRGLRR